MKGNMVKSRAGDEIFLSLSLPEHDLLLSPSVRHYYPFAVSLWNQTFQTSRGTILGIRKRAIRFRPRDSIDVLYETIGMGYRRLCLRISTFENALSKFAEARDESRWSDRDGA